MINTYSNTTDLEFTPQLVKLIDRNYSYITCKHIPNCLFLSDNRTLSIIVRTRCSPVTRHRESAILEGLYELCSAFLHHTFGHTARLLYNTDVRVPICYVKSGKNSKWKQNKHDFLELTMIL